MSPSKIVFLSFYGLGVVSTLLNYHKQYGASPFSLAGIIDCFVVPLILAAVFTGIYKVINKLVKKIKSFNEKNKGERS